MKLPSPIDYKPFHGLPSNIRSSRVLKLSSSIVADHVDVSCPIPLPIRSHHTADGDHGLLQKSLSSKNGFRPEGEALFYGSTLAWAVCVAFQQPSNKTIPCSTYQLGIFLFKIEIIFSNLHGFKQAVFFILFLIKKKL